jgi:hypothetical protein
MVAILEPDIVNAPPELETEILENAIYYERIGSVRSQFTFGPRDIDYQYLIDHPCTLKSCVRNKIEREVELHSDQLKETIKQGRITASLDPDSGELVAKHMFYEYIIKDQMKVIKEFGSESQYALWESVKYEYLTEVYPDIGEKMRADPLGTFVAGAITKPIEYAFKIGSSVVDQTIDSISASMGIDRHTIKYIFYGVIAILIAAGLTFVGFKIKKYYKKHKNDGDHEREL